MVRCTRVFGAIAALASGSLFAAAPAALGAWSAPQTVSRPGAVAGVRAGASGSAGELLTLSVFQPGPHGASGPERVFETTARPGGAFGAPRPLPASYATGPMVDLGGGRVAQLILLPAGTNEFRAQVALGSVSGRFGAPRTVKGALVFGGRASLAGDARGDLVLAYIAADPHGADRVVRASFASRGGSFCAPQTVSAGSQAEQVSAAMGPQGDAVVAFPDKYGHMLARIRRHGGSLGPLQRIGLAAGGNLNAVTPFVGADGSVVVVWFETQLCDACVSPLFTRAAVQPAHRSRFLHEQLLQRDPAGSMGVSGAPAVVAAGKAAPIVAFLAVGGAPPPPLVPVVVMVSRLQGTSFSRPQPISPSTEQAMNVAAAADGSRVLVSWVRVDPPSYMGGSVFAAVASAPRFAFGPPSQVSPSELGSGPLPLSAPATGGAAAGSWTVAWRRGTLAGTSSVVRVASGTP